MTYFIIAVVVLSILLAVSLVIAVKAAQARGRKLKEAETALESTRNELRRSGEYQKVKEEAQKHADAQKETLHTGNAAADFGSSIDVFNSAKGSRGR